MSDLKMVAQIEAGKLVEVQFPTGVCLVLRKAEDLEKHADKIAGATEAGECNGVSYFHGIEWKSGEALIAAMEEPSPPVTDPAPPETQPEVVP